MQKDIHPKQQDVVFHDTSADKYIIATSTIETSHTISIDNKKYPCAQVDVSSASHPYYTGKRSIVDATGRVDRFKKLTQKSKKAKGAIKTKKEYSKKKESIKKKTLADLS